MAVRIRGLKKATRNTLQIRKLIGSDASRAALSKPVAFARKTLKANVPVDEGRLKSAISSRRKSYRKNRDEPLHLGFIGARTDVKGKRDIPPYVYLRFLETGTVERTGRRLDKPASRQRGDWFTGRIHPAPAPVRKTFEQIQPRLKELFDVELARRFPNAVRKIDSRVGRDITRVRLG